MSKEAMKLALEALQKIYIAPEHEEYIRVWWPACEQAITALREALAEPQEKYIYGTPLLDAMTGKANEALDKKAENARELGLDYEPAQQYSATSDHRLMENAQGELERIKLVQTGVGIGKPEQEPVAPKCGAIIEVFGKDWRLEYMSLPVGKHKLYTQQYTYISPPAQRTWVSLTDEDVRQCSRDVVAGGPENSVDRFAYAIEAKLREKNQ